MDINNFIAELEEEIDDPDMGKFQPNTNYRDLEGWSSMHALIIIAHVDTTYSVSLNGEDLRTCATVQDLFDLVKSRV